MRKQNYNLVCWKCCKLKSQTSKTIALKSPLG